MYDVKPNLLIGFHGCDESVAHSLLTNPLDVNISKNPYDWLGNGFYVWENNLERAKIWAEDKLKRGAIENPAIIGIVFTLGNCCDLADSKYINSLNNYYHSMKNDFVKLGRTLPANKDYKLMLLLYQLIFQALTLMLISLSATYSSSSMFSKAEDKVFVVGNLGSVRTVKPNLISNE